MDGGGPEAAAETAALPPLGGGAGLLGQLQQGEAVHAEEVRTRRTAENYLPQAHPEGHGQMDFGERL